MVQKERQHNRAVNHLKTEKKRASEEQVQNKNCQVATHVDSLFLPSINNKQI